MNGSNQGTFVTPCSYRTYEEWKPGKPGSGKTLSAVSSYRTYEEWKPNLYIWNAKIAG